MNHHRRTKTWRQKTEYRNVQCAFERWTRRFRRAYHAELRRRVLAGERTRLSNLTPELLGIQRKLNRVRRQLHMPPLVGHEALY